MTRYMYCPIPSFAMLVAGFILNLETWKIGHFHNKSGKTWNSQGIFYDFYPSQGNVNEDKLFSQQIIFITYWLGCLQSLLYLLSVNMNSII